MSQPKQKTPAKIVPQTLEELEAALSQLHAYRRTLADASSALDKAVTLLAENAARDAKVIEEEIAQLSEGIQSFCEANRAKLTKGGKRKTVKFRTGEVCWRKGTARVALDREEDDVITSLKSMRLKRFIRIVEKLDRAEMLRNPAQARTVPGVSIVEGVESFYIEP